MTGTVYKYALACLLFGVLMKRTLPVKHNSTRVLLAAVVKSIHVAFHVSVTNISRQIEMNSNNLTCTL